LIELALHIVPLVGFALAVVAPGRPEWRISPLTDKSADRVSRAIVIYALILFVVAPITGAISPTYTQNGFIEIAGLHQELSATMGLIAVVLCGLAAINLVLPSNWRFRSSNDGETATEDRRPTMFARAMMLLCIAGVVLSMILSAVGYLNFAFFLAVSITLTLVTLGYALGLRIIVARGLHIATAAENQVGVRLRDRLMLDDAAAGRLVFWLMLLIDVVIATCVAAAIVIVWGLPRAVLAEVTDVLIYGIPIGNFTLSLVDIGVALGVFLLLLTGIRVFQRFLGDRVLVQTRLDVGARDALSTTVGYVGVVLATLIAATMLGLNLSNLALIFGALSVGIGFGLQHVVNNFLSGLILLVQRPIKTGDWIVVGAQQGYVRRISVISTEIQTFDAAAVIIPNSTMLSSEVVNWHLRNKLGRVTLRVGVSYDADPEQVRDRLLACAEEHPDVLKRPAPQVFFQDFGTSSLDFELRFFLREIDELLQVGSDLRFAIKRSFADANIEIPYPQRDLHIRSAGPLAQAITEKPSGPAESASVTPLRGSDRTKRQFGRDPSDSDDH
jgi:small-conductance mechanosensitive channel